MGRKGKWFGAVKKVFSPESKGKKNKKAKDKGSHPSASEPSDIAPHDSASPRPKEVKLAAAESEQSQHAHSAAAATSTAGESASMEVVRLAAPLRYVGKSKEEIATIKIQTAFRGYLARRALRALRGLVRLKSLIHGNSVKRQATITLHCMQTLARVQSQVRSRRIRMLEENQALQRQLLLKREKELDNLRIGDEWDDSLQSKQQIEASILSKQEAVVRRERALAYAFTHQGKNSSRSVNPMFMDPNNPHWGWSWLERWMAARPWESRSMTDKDINSDPASVKSASAGANGVGEITKAYARRDGTRDKSSPSTPGSKPRTPATKLKSASPRTGWGPPDDDARSVLNMGSERPNRRHSIPGSSVGDDESLASSPAVPSYMAPTRSARARSRFHSPASDTFEGLDKVSVGSAKKRLSFATTPAGPRRHSGPPKVDLAVATDVAAQ